MKKCSICKKLTKRKYMGLPCCSWSCDLRLQESKDMYESK